MAIGRGACRRVEDSRTRRSFAESLLATLKEANIKKGTAFIGKAAAKPSLFVDDEARPAMKQSNGSPWWIETGKLETGISHTFHYVAGGKRLGGRFDTAAYGPDS